MTLTIGTKLTHRTYGEGTISKITERKGPYGEKDDTIYTVDFGKVIREETVKYKTVYLTTADFSEPYINDTYFILD